MINIIIKGSNFKNAIEKVENNLPCNTEMGCLETSLPSDGIP